MSFFNFRNKIPVEEQQRFVDMIGKYGGIINKICYYYAANADDFNDLRQDVLINLWDGRRSFCGKSKESTWIYRIALNTCISSFKKRKHRGISVSIDSLINLPSDDASLLEQHSMLHSMIQRLSHREKAVILLWLDGADYESIVDVTGINRNTVATLLRRGKEKLNRMANS